jgi:hypothetical protein
VSRPGLQNPPLTSQGPRQDERERETDRQTDRQTEIKGNEQEKEERPIPNALLAPEYMFSGLTHEKTKAEVLP